VAHNIKGVAANLGALQLSEYAGKLEKHAGEGYTYHLENEIKKLQEISDIFILDAASFLGKF
jgi:HPt (histidine-containing phosphotransfer) domain-containing protein